AWPPQRGAAAWSACRGRSRAAGREVRSLSRALFFLAGYADARPRNGVQPGRGYLFSAITANAVGALLHPVERFLDRLKDLRVGLLELQLDVYFVVAAGLVGQIPLPRVDFNRRRQRF